MLKYNIGITFKMNEFRVGNCYASSIWKWSNYYAHSVESSLHYILHEQDMRASYTGRSKSLSAPDNYSTEQSPCNWWVEDGHHRIHSECGPCYTEHGLREHSLACQ
jgi:hypothetical protein